MKKLLIIMLTCALVLSGCSDEFFDINKSPNSATEDNMTPSLVLPRALHRLADISATGNREYAFWMGYWARCAGGYGPNTDEEEYKLTTSFKRTAWLEMYDMLKDFDVIEKNAVSRDETAYEGIAKIMKSIGFMQLVDQYNNVPYSKAFNLGEYMLTPYDKGVDIYAALITDLEAADALLADAKVSDNLDLETADVMFAGDLEMLRKLGNTQRLRLLIHQTGLLTDAQLKTEVDKIDATIGFLGAGETASVQPGYAKDVNKQNPFWDTYNTNDAGGTDNFNRANNFILKLLMNNDDIRYTRFFAEASAPVNNVKYAGYDFGVESQVGQLTASQSSMVSGPGLISGASDPLWLFTSFESLFLQAEAVQRGALAGVAKDAYEAAVKESFIWLGLTAADANTYLTNTDKTIGNWDQNADKLMLIAKQKYIAMCGVNGLETYTEYRRTGYPSTADILSVRAGITNSIPKRLIYPIEEYNYNAANALAEGTINPQTATIFWDVN